MAAGTQQTGNLGDSGSGENSTDSNSNQNDFGSNVGTGGDGANANDNGNGSSSDNGKGQSGNTGGTDGSGSSASGNGAGNHGFDGEFDPARARNLIDTLRDENKTLSQQNKQLASEIAELKELIKGSGKEGESKPSEGGSDAAMEAVAKLRQELAEERLASRFTQLATSMGMRPEAVEMAFSAVRDSINVVNGSPTNLTEVVGGLRSTQGFMFASVSQGQQQGGSSGGGTAQAAGGDMPTDLERAQMKAGGLTLEQLRELQKGGRPNYTMRS